MGESKQVAANTNTVPSVRFPLAHFVRVVLPCIAWVRRHVTVEDIHSGSFKNVLDLRVRVQVPKPGWIST